MIDEKMARYLDLDEGQGRRLEALSRDRILEVAPVALPEGRLVPGDYRHLGWPVATAAAGALIVVFNATSRPAGDDPGGGAGGHMVTRSLDGGRSWSRPEFLSVFLEHAPARGPGMCAVGTTRGGQAVVIQKDGFFVSGDGGTTWEHRESRWPDLSNAITGPRVIDHPRFGLVFAVRFRNGPLAFLVSGDGGAQWRACPVEWEPGKGEESFRGTVSRRAPAELTPGPFAPAEPTVFDRGEDFAVFSRNHCGPVNADYHRAWSLFACFAPVNGSRARRFEDLEFTGRLAGIFARRMDTPDASWNPLTDRIEVVVSKRNEGFPRADDRCRSLNLWSIGPGDFLAGRDRWRFECVLLRCPGVFSRGHHPGFPPREGLHPAGAVIDEKNRLQHVFFFAGDRNHAPPRLGTGRTGVFRLSRTLDTAALGRRSRELDGYDNLFPRLEESFETLDAWTLSGRPPALALDADKDVSRRLVAPLPGGRVEGGGRGLLVRTGPPGYYGICREDAPVTAAYRVELRARVERWAESGVTLGVNTACGPFKNYLVIGPDGIHERVESAGLRRLAEIETDREWHTWSVEVDGRNTRVFRDGALLARGRVLVDDRPGEDDAPVGIFAHPGPGSGPAIFRVACFRLINRDS